MNSPYVRILGAPEGVGPDGKPVRFDYALAWAVLASLLMAEGTVPRAELCERFWPDRDSARGRDALKKCLQAIKDAFGPILVEGRRDVTGLAEPRTLTCDWRDGLDELVRLANDPCPEETARLLGAFCARVRGPFLQGLASKETDDAPESGWLDHQRAIVGRQCAQALVRYAWGLVEDGALPSALQAAGRAFEIDPTFEGDLRRIERLNWARGSSTVLARAVRMQAAGIDPTPGEAAELDGAVEELVGDLSPRLRRAARVLACFDGPLAEDDVERFTLLSTRDLGRLAERGLAERGEGGWEMTTVVRFSLGRNAADPRAVADERDLARDLLAWVARRAVPSMESPSPSRTTLLRAAIRALPSSEPTPQLVGLATYLLIRERPDDPAPLVRWVERAAAAEDPALRFNAAYGLGDYARSLREFSKSADWYKIASACGTPDAVAAVGTSISLMESLHHAAQHDQAYAAGRAVLTMGLPNLDENRESRARSVMSAICRSLGLHEESVDHAELALHLARTLDPGSKWHAECLNQAALAQAALNNDARALERWTEALPLWIAVADLHGEGDAYRGLASVALRQGRPADAIGHLRYAASLYLKVEQDQSHAAALGDLGDVYARLGDLDHARSLYERGLSVWRRWEHPSWIAIFNQRLLAVAVS